MPQKGRGTRIMFDLSLHQLIIRLGASIIIVSIHGFALAAIARTLGDRGPEFDERLTLNPISHLDVLGAAMMILFQLGWIRPIAIDPSAMRLGRLGLFGCVFGSLAVTLAAVILLLGSRLPVLSYMPTAIAPTVIATLNGAVEMCTWFAVFNLLPLPPLTGAHFLVAARPSFAPLLAKYQIYAAIGLAALILAGAPQSVLQPGRDAIASLLPGP
jgi:Zn-dependent protease